MKLKQISTAQFAGIRDQNIAFSDGLNVIYGKNESGKSTLVNLLSRTLFQRVHMDGRSSGDKEFRELFFPGACRAREAVGDFIDGRISFESKDGTYTLTKEWGNGSQCMLSTPDGVIRDQKKIDTQLRELLLYGEGVYSDILFSSQRSTDVSLQAIMDAAKKTEAKQEIASTVSRAFAESDGIAVEEIEQAIAKKIGELTGKHWDTSRCRPAPRSGRWTNSLGEVLTAYYALEDVQAQLDKISELEKAVDDCAAAFAEAETTACSAEEAYQHFSAFAKQLAILDEKRKAAVRFEADARRYGEVLDSWPRLAKNLEKAKSLQIENAGRECLDRYESAQKIKKEWNALDQNLLEAKCPTREEIQTVRTARNSITALQNKLSAMNLSAALNLSDGHTIEIRSLRTGQALDVSGETFSITEAVKITVPGVMELQLAPAHVNVAEVQSQIAEKEKNAHTVLENYQVDSLEKLEELAQEISEVSRKSDSIRERLSDVLGPASFEEAEASAKKITGPIRSRETILAEMKVLCGIRSLDSYITAAETRIDGYRSAYGDMDALKRTARETKEELKKANRAIEQAEGIPEEYRAITDPEGHLKKLKDGWDAARKVKDDSFQRKAAASTALENYQSNLSGDPVAEVENAARVFEERKVLLAHWQHIAQVFAEKKAHLSDNPMEDIAKSFTRYLGIISDGKVSSEFPEANRLKMSIYSDDRLLDYGKLSEGTKETVSLAFRLAVLDHLFPEGGGMIVLDDPLTNMDRERVAQSCALVHECAKRHQVIFLTCHDEYLEPLGGNVIRLS